MSHSVSSPEQIEQRFWSYVDKSPDGCWLWTRCRAGYKKHYGRFCTYQSFYEYAHRYAYRITYGDIPDSRDGRTFAASSTHDCGPAAP
jgi:hypothetical protein